MCKGKGWTLQLVKRGIFSSALGSKYTNFLQKFSSNTSCGMSQISRFSILLIRFFVCWDNCSQGHKKKFPVFSSIIPATPILSLPLKFCFILISEDFRRQCKYFWNTYLIWASIFAFLCDPWQWKSLKLLFEALTQ